MVLVITLRNGHPQNREAHKLYFDYSTQYHHFLEALQTTTQNSVIPPVDVAALNRAIDDDSSVSLPNALGISSSTPPASFNSPSISDTRSLRPHDISGYVLEDGPWLYRVVIDRKVVSGQTVNGVAVKDREIKDKSTYSAMLEVIKTAKAGMAADERLTVLIKHVSSPCSASPTSNANSISPWTKMYARSGNTT